MFLRAQAIISAPAENLSGSGSLDAPAIPLVTEGEYGTIPKGAPAQGFNESDREFFLRASLFRSLFYSKCLSTFKSSENKLCELFPGDVCFRPKLDINCSLKA